MKKLIVLLAVAAFVGYGWRDLEDYSPLAVESLLVYLALSYMSVMFFSVKAYKWSAAAGAVIGLVIVANGIYQDATTFGLTLETAGIWTLLAVCIPIFYGGLMFLATLLVMSVWLRKPEEERSSALLAPSFENY